MKTIYCLSLFLLFSACQYPEQQTGDEEYYSNKALDLTLEQAERLSALPMKCLEQEYPNKLNQVLSGADELLEPHRLHPAFYGCFDWHSAVHGTWMMLRLMREFPAMEQDSMRQTLSRLISTENVMKEIAFFESTHNENFERTYGWGWLLKLHGEMLLWEDSLGQNLAATLEPLADYIVKKYERFLPKLEHPLRSGEHINTAFALSRAYDYAKRTEHKSFQTLIVNKAKVYFGQDRNANLSYEPSGFDFLSPILEEINLMRKVLPKHEFHMWLKKFLPEIYNLNFHLSPLRVSDRSDGKLVHLDGLNLSRAWCLYALSNVDKSLVHLRKTADAHLEASLGSIVDGDYMGEHWLASFALHALLERERIH